MLELAMAVIANTALGAAAYHKKSLSRSGLAAGILLGTIIFYAGGPGPWMVMGAFFVSSSILSSYKKSVKEGMARRPAKGGRRDWAQVLANGGAGCAMAVCYRITGDHLFLLLLTAAFASANADTWGSEIGALARKPPVSIISLKPVPAGSSGGVSLPGLAASLAGAAFIALIAGAALALFSPVTAFLSGRIAVAASCGFLGSVCDSLLGATIQAKYRETITGNEVETAFTRGVPNERIGGFRVIDNDMVNFLSTLAATAAAYILALPFGLAVIG